MIFEYIRKNFLPQEIVILPFAVLVIIVYHHFNLNFVYVPEFIYWLIISVILFLLLYLTYLFFAEAIKYIFKGNLGYYSINFNKLKSFSRVLIALILILVIYENLQYALVHISAIDQDEALLFYDNLIFGKDHITILLQPFVNKWLTEWFSFAYISFFFYLPVFAIYFFVKNNLKEWSLLVLTIAMTLFAGFIFYLFFPALGPGVYLHNQFSLDLNGLYIANATSQLVNTQGFARGTFPSLHMACSVVYLFFAYMNSRKLFIVFLPVIISLWISTIYLRHHYVIDLVAGLFLAVICIYFADLIFKKWYGFNKTKLDE